MFLVLSVRTNPNKYSQIANEKLLYFVFFYDVDNEGPDIIYAYASTSSSSPDELQVSLPQIFQCMKQHRFCGAFHVM